MTETNVSFEPDQVVGIWHYGKPAPDAGKLAALLPEGWHVGNSTSWRTIVRDHNGTGVPASEVSETLAAAGHEAKPVERETNAIYQFRTGKDGGSGSFLSPPGHANLNYSIYGYHSSGSGKPRTNRSSGPDAIFSLDGLAEDEDGYYPAAAVRRARRILAEQQTEPSEYWVRHTYGYFRNSYSPDGKDRNVSNAITWKPGDENEHRCSCRQKFSSAQALIGHIAGKRKDLGFDPEFAAKMHHRDTPAKPQPPEHHLGYLMVKSYFPGHQPRTDLIAHPEACLYGTHPCVKCGERCQYEARKDAFCVAYRDGRWVYDTTCPKGGEHEVPLPEIPHDDNEGTCASCGCERGQS